MMGIMSFYGLRFQFFVVTVSKRRSHYVIVSSPMVSQSVRPVKLLKLVISVPKKQNFSIKCLQIRSLSNQ